MQLCVYYNGAGIQRIYYEPWSCCSPFLPRGCLPEHAVAALIFPVLLRVRDALGQPKQSSRYIQSLFLGLAWGASIGGIVTYLGGARAPLAAALVTGAGYGEEIPGFFAYLAWSLPVALPMLLILLIVLHVRFPIDVTNLDAAQHILQQRRRELGRMQGTQWGIIGALIAAIALWFILGRQALAPIALAVPAAIIACGWVRWKDVEQHVSWSTLLSYGAALALAAGLARARRGRMGCTRSHWSS